MADPTDTLMASEDALEASEPSIRQRIAMLSATKVTYSRFDIDLTRPLIDYEHPYAEAYEAAPHETGLNDHVALVIKDRYPARQDMITACLSSDFVNVVSLREAGTVYWIPDGSYRFVIIYRRPGGTVALPKHLPRREPLSEDVVRHGVIRPLAHALRSFEAKSLFHGNIRPDNFFLTVSENTEGILGEGASSIPGINQPALYETLERGMADVEGKGIGTSQDDIYAFGATVAVLLRGFNPMEGKDARTVIDEKIIRGSYSVLTDGLRLSPGLAEFLRGTLNDDPRQRWTIDQLISWVDGNRTTPKQAPGANKAQRAIDFNSKKYIRPRMLAKDLHENPTEALTLIESGQISKWIERALGDQEMADQVNAALGRASVGGRTAGYEDRVLCFVSMALDPRAPIRFKDLRVFPTGIGYSLAHTIVQNKKTQNYGELIRDRYAWNWLSNKENNPNDIKSDHLHVFDQASKTITRRGIDFGLERCLYEICKSCPCLSPLFPNHYVITCGILLQAIEDVAKDKKGDRPMDRHIACFISVNDSRDNAGLLLLLEGGNVMKKSLAIITLYQGLQKRNDNPKLPNLCEWLMHDAEVVAQRFHNLPLKQEITKQLPKMIHTGNLTKVMELIDNPLEVKKDEHDFIQAGRYYHAVEREKEIMRKNLNTDRTYGRKQGRQIAMAISMIISAIMVSLTLLLMYLGNGVLG